MIGLFNWSGHGNLGDDAMASILEEELEAENLQERFEVEKDWYILGGGTLISPGSIFMDKPRHWERTIGFGLGAGDSWEGEWADNLKRMKRLYVRDQYTHDKLAQYGIESIPSYDPVCLLKAPKRTPKPRIMLNFVYPTEQRNEVDYMAQIEEYFDQYKDDPREKIYFAMSGVEDVQVMKDMGVEPVVYTDAKVLLADMAEAQQIVTTRLHANILAWMSGVPTKTVMYDNKIQHFQDTVRGTSWNSIRQTLQSQIADIKKICR